MTEADDEERDGNDYKPEHLGLEPNEDMSSDTAFDRLAEDRTRQVRGHFP